MKKICIIGAGIAGISAAVQLIEKGLSVDIYEATDSVGGRVSSVFDNKTSTVIDNGQHLLVGAYKRFQYLLKLFGTENELKKLKGLDINYIDSNNSYRLFTGSLPGDLGQLAGLLAFNALSLGDKFNLIKLALKIKSGKILSELSCYDFLKDNKQSDNSILYFWEPLILATINNSIYESPAQLMINILKDAFFNSKKMSSLILPVTDLQKLIQPFENYIEANNSKLLKNTKVKEIIIENKKIRGIKLKSGEIKEYDYVISALPPFALTKILPVEYLDLEFDFLKQFEYSPILSAYMWYDAKMPEKDIFALICTNSQWLFNKSNFSADVNKNFSLLSVTISNAVEMSNNSPKTNSEIIHQELTTFFPHLSDKLLHSRIITEKFATFRSDIKTEKIRPLNNTQIQGLYLAGDWTDTGYPATIEGAALSGAKSSDIIINKLKNKFNIY